MCPKVLEGENIGLKTPILEKGIGTSSRLAMIEVISVCLRVWSS